MLVTLQVEATDLMLARLYPKPFYDSAWLFELKSK
ncbi:hypothetical protein OKW33_006417 [Paraburkholderia atlantica]|uniref:Uncharacterized protein n=1 Tax=Paraburkholderia atlantica TaxID=2654982 RepID=A0A7W8QFU5_PARAM|nr:hypothetical protein [Paraburkholderia atlantica]